MQYLCMGRQLLSNSTHPTSVRLPRSGVQHVQSLCTNGVCMAAPAVGFACGTPAWKCRSVQVASHATNLPCLVDNTTK